MRIPYSNGKHRGLGAGLVVEIVFERIGTIVDKRFSAVGRGEIGKSERVSSGDPVSASPGPKQVCGTEEHRSSLCFDHENPRPLRYG